MSDMKDWLPLVNSAVVGLVTLFGIVVTQAWTSRRERHAKTLEIEDRRHYERNDFQRKTLLRLQVALRQYARAVGSALHHIRMEHRRTGTWGRLLSDEMDQAIYDTLASVQLLSNRVNDDELREIIDGVNSSAIDALTAKSATEAEPHSRQFSEGLKQANDRLGETLRKLL
jgi:hypothetical protein